MPENRSQFTRNERANSNYPHCNAIMRTFAGNKLISTIRQLTNFILSRWQMENSFARVHCLVWHPGFVIVHDTSLNHPLPPPSLSLSLSRDNGHFFIQLRFPVFSIAQNLFICMAALYREGRALGSRLRYIKWLTRTTGWITRHNNAAKSISIQTPRCGWF